MDNDFAKGKNGEPPELPVPEVKPPSLKDKAAAHADKAIQALVEVLDKEKASDIAKISAAKELLDRGFGKATQYVEQTTKLVTYQDLLDTISEKEEAYQKVVVDAESVQIAPPALTWDDLK